MQDLSLVGTAVSPRVALKVLSNNKRRMVLFEVTSLSLEDLKMIYLFVHLPHFPIFHPGPLTLRFSVFHKETLWNVFLKLHQAIVLRCSQDPRGSCFCAVSFLSGSV